MSAPAGERRAIVVDFACLLASMGLWAASFHPLDLWPLGFFALVPAWVRMSRAGAGRRRLGLQWMFAQYWLHVALMGWAGVIAPPLSFLTPLLGLPFSWLTGFLLERGVVRLRLPLLPVAPLVVVLVELLRDQALLGLSWASIGYGQWRFEELLQLASVGRVHLPSFVVLCASAALASAIVAWRAGRPCVRPVLWGLAIVVCAAVVGRAIKPEGFEPGPLAAALQPNVSQKERKLVRATGNLRIHADLLAEVREHTKDAPPDLLVYSETSFPPTQEPEHTLESFLAHGVLRSGVGGPGPAVSMRDFVLSGEDQTTILGLVRRKALPEGARGGARDDDGDGYDETNVAWVVRGGRPTAACYEKRGLAPFGEYTPLPRGFPGREAVQGLMRKALGTLPAQNPGTGPVLFSAASPSGDRRGGLTICFEVPFPRYFRESAALGADFHVNISNDAWFDGSSELALVDVATRFRAVETGRAVLRVSNSGISTLFGPDGRRIAVVADSTGRTTQVRGWLVGRIPIGSGKTWWVRAGDGPWILPAFGLVLAFAVATIRAKRFLPGTHPR